MAKLKIKMVRSLIGRSEKQRRIMDSLGLKKINDTVIHNDTPDIRGKVNKLSHLITVEETES